jgi:hypothetical protein
MRPPPRRELRALIDVVDNFVRAFLAGPQYVGSGESKDRDARTLEEAIAPSVIARLIGRSLMERMTVSFGHY